MKRSDTFGEITKAFIKFKKEHPKVPASEEVQVRNREGRFLYAYYYASLETIMDTVQEHLLNNGLAISQTIGENNMITTLLMHESGEYMEDTMSIDSLKVKDANYDAKDFGGLITYARRFTAAAMLGIPAESQKKSKDPNFKEGSYHAQQQAPANQTIKMGTPFPPKEESQRDWLNENHKSGRTTDDWDRARRFICDEGGTIEHLKKHFKIARATLQKLTDLKAHANQLKASGAFTEAIKKQINASVTTDDLKKVFEAHPELKDSAEFIEALGEKKMIINTPSHKVA